MHGFSNTFVIGRVAGYQRLVVCKRYRLDIFEQIVAVVYLKRQPPELFCRKRYS